MKHLKGLLSSAVPTAAEMHCLLSTEEVGYKDIIQNKSQILGTPFKGNGRNKFRVHLLLSTFRFFM